MTIQVRNPELVNLLKADLQARYEPNFAWKSMASTLLALPMLRGAWVASVNSTGNWYDIGGLGKTLTYNGNPTFNFSGLAPYWDYDGAGDFHSRLDEADLDVLGTESYVAAAARGLTVGGWFWCDTFPGVGVVATFIAKWEVAGNQCSFRLEVNDAAVVAFRVSGDGLASTAASATVGISTGAWYFLVGRLVPSTSVDVYVSNTKYTNAVGVPAAIFNSGASFRIGATTGTVGFLDGRAALCFLCAAALSDAQIGALFQQTRATFGV